MITLPYLIPYFLLTFLSFSKINKIDKFIFFSLWLIFTIYVGFRYEVGSDWGNYFIHSQEGDLNLFRIIQKFVEPLYCFTLWISNIFRWGIVGLNSLNAGVFIFGLLFLCRRLAFPFVGLLSAFPYLIIVVGMNYINQSAAIGAECIALVYFIEKNYKLFYLFLIVAILFHYSAFYLCIFPILESIFNYKKKSAYIVLTLIIGSVYFAINSFFLNLFKGNYVYYFERNFNSTGALLKIFIIVLFGIGYLLIRDKFDEISQERKLLDALTLNSFVLLVFYFIVPSSAVVYRLSLYLYPLQIIVGSSIAKARLFDLSVQNWKTIFVVFYFMLLFVWLNYSYHAVDWLPYKNILFM